VLNFEKAAGLPADGVVDDTGWQLLISGNIPSRGGSGSQGYKPGASPDGNANTKLKKMVLGYYTEYYPGDNLSYDSLSGYSAMIDGIATFSYQIDGQGNLTGQPISQGINLAKSKKVKALMVIHNVGSYIDSDAAHAVLSVGKNRKNLEDNILWLIKKNGFDGVNIDLEGVPAGDRDNYSALLAELKDLFRTNGYLLTVSIPAKTSDNPGNDWNWAYDYRTIGKTADLITLMTYDEHWPGGDPGPIASLPWVQQVLDYAVQVMPKEKILMGIAAYGYDWSNAGTQTVLWNKADSLAARYGGAKWDNQSSTPYFVYYDWQGNKHEVWFENKYSLRMKLDLANSYNIGGIALWRLGLEDASFWQTVGEKFS
jgi:spore germination protein YaaH